ncbi:hypothetical protein BLOT_006624 [Blomia tropicalis]|nr:hypothetical protein BLOT_006624 [Blomia tropicalis]
MSCSLILYVDRLGANERYERELGNGATRLLSASNVSIIIIVCPCTLIARVVGDDDDDGGGGGGGGGLNRTYVSNH